MYAEICFPIFINKTFTYFVPKNLEPNIDEGSVVNVTFNNQICNGIVVTLSSTTLFSGHINNILSIDQKYKIPHELWSTLKWAENYYITPIGKVVQVALVWLFKKNNTQPRTIKYIQLNTQLHPLQHYKKHLNGFTNNEQLIIKILLKIYPDSISLVELRQKLKSIYNIYKSLKSKNIIIESIKAPKSALKIANQETTDNIKLTTKQNIIYNDIYKKFQKNNKPHFLYGITGSGKTEIYLKLTNHFFNKGKSCLILIPEIALSTQIYHRFKHFFGSKVLLWHSQETSSQKKNTWNKINSDQPYIIVGARSAIFVPLYNLGLIIIDEEHDESYKESERQPCYNARDLAIIRGKFSKSMVLLGSATPSLETYYNSIINKYNLYSLNERYGESILPQIQLINMQKTIGSFTSKPILNDTTIQAINQTLNKKEQILVLHNRRGYSTLKICNDSNKILKCSNCDVVLTFHLNSNKLICHYCNRNYHVPTTNNITNNNIVSLGYGTEQLELLFNKLFPNNNILRMDSDSANSRSKQNKILNKFKTGQCNILLGTQMIAKGLDFANVTLVVVVNADLGMMVPNFKSHEKMFQLISQVIGRSGRSHKKGKAIIQTYFPQNNIIQMATNYEHKKFYNMQLESRKSLNYPPFIRLIRIIFESTNSKFCHNNAKKIFNILDSSFSQILIGPLLCPIEKLSNKFRYHILIKAPHSQFKAVSQKIKDIQIQKESLLSKQVRMLIDIDPNSVL